MVTGQCVACITFLVSILFATLAGSHDAIYSIQLLSNPLIHKSQKNRTRQIAASEPALRLTAGFATAHSFVRIVLGRLAL